SGTAGCGAQFLVDNYISVAVGQQTQIDAGSVPGDPAGPVAFSAYPGTQVVISLYDDGGGRILSPLILCKDGVFSEPVSPGVPASNSPCCLPTPVVVYQK